jgi:hypothetical protein
MNDITAKVPTISKIVESLYGSPPVFILDTEKTPFCGGEYAVFAVEIEQANVEQAKRRLCIRLPRLVTKLYTSLLLSREVDLRQRIESANVYPFQKLITFDASYDNALQSPYMILGWADGKPLSWTDSSPEGDFRKTVLRKIANASLDLLKVSESGSSFHMVSCRLFTTNLVQARALGIGLPRRSTGKLVERPTTRYQDQLYRNVNSKGLWSQSSGFPISMMHRMCWSMGICRATTSL